MGLQYLVPHKERHALGGSDALTPADIGAASNFHEHLRQDITNLPESFQNRAPLYSRIVISGASPSFLNGPLDLFGLSSVNDYSRPNYEGERSSGERVQIIYEDDVFQIRSIFNGVTTWHANSAEVERWSPIGLNWNVWDTPSPEAFPVTISGKFAFFVPAPAANDNTKFLKGDGTWVDILSARLAFIQDSTPSDTTVISLQNNTWHQYTKTQPSDFQLRLPQTATNGDRVAVRRNSGTSTGLMTIQRFSNGGWEGLVSLTSIGQLAAFSYFNGWVRELPFHTHAIADTTGLQTALDAKVTGVVHAETIVPGLVQAALELRETGDVRGGAALKLDTDNFDGSDPNSPNPWIVARPDKFRDAISAASTSHKSTHAIGGSDALTPADIGALPDAIVVSGAGTAGVNGTYTRGASIGTYPAWYKGSNIIRARASGVGNNVSYQWVIETGAVILFASVFQPALEFVSPVGVDFFVWTEDNSIFVVTNASSSNANGVYIQGDNIQGYPAWYKEGGGGIIRVRTSDGGVGYIGTQWQIENLAFLGGGQGPTDAYFVYSATPNETVPSFSPLGLLFSPNQYTSTFRGPSAPIITPQWLNAGLKLRSAHTHAIADTTGLQATLDSKIPATEKGAANGVATLDANQKLTSSQIPDLAITDFLGACANQAEMLAKTGQKGDWVTRADDGKVYVITGGSPSNASSWTALSYPAAPTNFTGSNGTAAGTAGLVPAPAADDNTKFLKGDGTWAIADGLPVIGTENTYVFVLPGDDLEAAYAGAKTARLGWPFTDNNNLRYTIFILPGEYNLASELAVNGEKIDLVGLGAQTQRPAVLITGNTLNVTANDVRVSGISTNPQQFNIGDNKPLQVFENCTGGNNSFGYSGTASGTFTNCTGGNASFGSGGTASGTFTNCAGRIESFGGGSGGALTGKLFYCRLTSGSFPTPSGAGIIRLSLDGSNNIVNAG